MVKTLRSTSGPSKLIQQLCGSALDSPQRSSGTGCWRGCISPPSPRPPCSCPRRPCRRPADWPVKAAGWRRPGWTQLPSLSHTYKNIFSHSKQALFLYLWWTLACYFISIHESFIAIITELDKDVVKLHHIRNCLVVWNKNTSIFSSYKEEIEYLCLKIYYKNWRNHC